MIRMDILYQFRHDKEHERASILRLERSRMAQSSVIGDA